MIFLLFCLFVYEYIIDEIILIYCFKKFEIVIMKKIIRFLEMLIIYLKISIIVYEIRSYYIKMRYMYKDWYVCMCICMYINLWYMIIYLIVLFYLFNFEY